MEGKGYVCGFLLEHGIRLVVWKGASFGCIVGAQVCRTGGSSIDIMGDLTREMEQ